MAFFPKFLPALRRELRILLRIFADRHSGVRSRLAGAGSIEIFDNTDSLEIEQAVRKTTLSQNKIKNIRIAAKSINLCAIAPGEIFSFWHLVGRPSRARGYLEGRMLVKGYLGAEIGGGLCQLSGLLYHLSLRAGLKILERHPHSVDIYAEDERFTPLGADAAVVFGVKDLRFENNYNFPIRFDISIENNKLTGRLTASGPLLKHEISFERQRISNSQEEVRTIISGINTQTEHQRNVYTRNQS